MEIESKNNLARLCILISKLKESNSFNPKIFYDWRLETLLHSGSAWIETFVI